MSMDSTTGIDKATTCCDSDDLPSAFELASQAVRILNDLHLSDERWSYIVTGSVVFNGSGNDVDIVVGQPDGPSGVDDESFVLGGVIDKALVKSGWHCTAREGYPGNHFITFRKDRFNLIVTMSPLQHWMMARNACAALSILNGGIDKAERVAVHQAIIAHAEEVNNIGATIAEQSRHFRDVK